MLTASKTTGIALDVASTVGSVAPGVVTLLDKSRFKNNGTFAFGGGGSIPTYTKLSSGLWHLNFVTANKSYINFGNPISLRLNNKVSVSAWANYQSAAAGLHAIYYKGQLYFCMGISSGIFFAYVGNGAASTLYFYAFNYYPVLNRWYHFVVTVDGTNVIAYWNGVLKRSTAQVQTLTDSGINASIGADTVSSTYATEKIAAVKVYNYALTPAQIRNIYNREKRYFPDVN